MCSYFKPKSRLPTYSLSIQIKKIWIDIVFNCPHNEDQCENGSETV